MHIEDVSCLHLVINLLLYQVRSLLFVRSLTLSLHFALLQISTFHIVDLITQLLLHSSHNIINAMDSLPYMVYTIPYC